MRQLTIRTRLLIAAAVAAIGAFVLAGLSVLGNQRGNAALESMLNGNMRPLLELQRIDASLSAVRYRAAGVLLDHYPIPGTLTHLRETRKVIETSWTAVKDGATTSDEQAALRKEMIAGWERVPAMLGKLEKAYGANEKNAIDDLLQGEWAAMHKAFIKPMSALLPLQEAAAQATFERARGDARTATATALAVAAVMLPLVVGIMVLTARSVASSLSEAAQAAHAIAAGDLSGTGLRPAGRDEVGRLLEALHGMRASLARLVDEIRQSAESIQTASGEVASGNQDLSQRTEQAASNLQQTASSIEQLTGTVSHSADSAHTANELAASAAQVATRGGEVVSQVVTTMADINNSSRRIADIIGTIDGIAFQTNILALNAAVEAARAGEQGRGFAVVASEVRSLAQRSAEAAREIKTLIGASVAKVDAGSQLVGQAGSTMSEIVTSVRRVTDVIGEISSAAGEQRQGIGEVNQAVSQLDRMTQQNAALVEQSAAAAQSLNDQARKLAASVAVFRL